MIDLLSAEIRVALDLELDFPAIAILLGSLHLGRGKWLGRRQGDGEEQSLVEKSVRLYSPTD